MGRNDIRETLEKQLQLLSERSADAKNWDYMGLVEITKAMCTLVNTITFLSGPSAYCPDKYELRPLAKTPEQEY